MVYKVIVTNSHKELGLSVAKQLQLPIVDVSLSNFSNGETSVRINESIRGNDLIIISTGSSLHQSNEFSGCSLKRSYPSVNQRSALLNDHLMELFLLIHGCRSSSAKSITVIIPYLPYSRADKRDHRGPISAKFVVDTLVNAGATRIMSIDLHAAQIQGFTNIPFDNLYAINTFTEYINTHIFTQSSTNDEINNKYILVSPDLGGSKRVTEYAKKLNMRLIKMEKERDYSKMNTVAKCSIIGDVENLKNKIAIIIDDMVDTMGTMLENTKTIMESGAKGVIIVATHGILSGPALKRIEETEGIIKVIVSNTLPIKPNCTKIVVVEIDSLIAMAMSMIINDGSISSLFKDDKP